MKRILVEELEEILGEGEEILEEEEEQIFLVLQKMVYHFNA